MNWNDLANEIVCMTPEQRMTDVTVFVPGMDEFYAVKGRILITNEDDVLDSNHPYISL